MMGALLRVRELQGLRIDEKRGGSGTEIAEVLANWIKGERISKIAEHPAFEADDKTERVTLCVEALSKITDYASWGMGALQALSMNEEALAKMDPRSKLEIRSIPALIYFGVPTVEGMLMRNLSVPRSIAPSLGELYREKIQNDLPTISDASKWLESVDESTWNKCTPPGSKVTGSELRDVWRIFNGDYPITKATR
jgi:hypothetical protein